MQCHFCDCNETASRTQHNLSRTISFLISAVLWHSTTSTSSSMCVQLYYIIQKENPSPPSSLSLEFLSVRMLSFHRCILLPATTAGWCYHCFSCCDTFFRHCHNLQEVIVVVLLAVEQPHYCYCFPCRQFKCLLSRPVGNRTTNTHSCDGRKSKSFRRNNQRFSALNRVLNFIFLE